MSALSTHLLCLLQYLYTVLRMISVPETSFLSPFSRSSTKVVLLSNWCSSDQFCTNKNWFCFSAEKMIRHTQKQPGLEAFAVNSCTFSWNARKYMCDLWSCDEDMCWQPARQRRQEERIPHGKKGLIGTLSFCCTFMWSDFVFLSFSFVYFELVDLCSLLCCLNALEATVK